MKTARPYRSHKYPACSRCHKRRSRCTVEIPGQACLLCRMHGVPCSSATMKKDDRSTPKIGFIHRSLVPNADALNDMSHIVGPIVARDTQILDQYLPVNINGSSAHPTITKRNAQTPIYSISVPARRPSPSECSCSRDLAGELLTQVDPFLDKLLAAFFEQIHPCFPITVEHCVMNMMKDRSQMPRTFLVNLIAHVSFYWDLFPTLATYARPNQDFAWQVGVSALVADIQKSDLATIVAAVINIAGRPSRCVVNNTTNVARIVALSHAIGLNHDCSDWKLPDAERKFRWKAWWGVLIHDRWFNFAQGTPPYISKGHYDVRIPTLEILTIGKNNTPRYVRAAEVYVHFCRLTEIVGDVLPLIYHIRSGNDTIAAEQTSRSEIDLNRWLESRPTWLDLNDFQNRPPVPGLANLQLSYLSVRMLLRRIAWHEISQRETDPASSWLQRCQTAAEDIVRLVVSLNEHDLRGFWLPYNAHHFTSAVTLLLRCALQTCYSEIRSQCMISARTLVDTLRQHQEKGWDLADTALASSESILKRIEDAMPSTPSVRSPNIETLDDVRGHSSGFSYLNDSHVLHQHHHHQYVEETSRLGDSPMSYQFSGAIEDAFPDIFSDFTDVALLVGTNAEQPHG